MRYLLVVFSLIFLLGLASYDLYRMRLLKADASALEEISRTIELRTKSRGKLHDFLRSARLSENLSDVVSEFGNSGFFTTKQQFYTFNKSLADWPYIKEWIQARQGLAEKIRAFHALKTDLSQPELAFDYLDVWGYATSGILQRLQVLESEALRFLMKRCSDSIRILVYVNVPVIAVILALLWGFVFFRLRASLRILQVTNTSLESKKIELQKTQRVMASILDDIKQEKNRAVSLARENQHLASVVQETNDAVLRLDTLGNIISYNKAAQQLFQRRGILQGAWFPSLFAINDHAAILSAIQQAATQSLPTLLQLHPLIRVAGEYSDQNNKSTGESLNHVYEASFAGLKETQNTERNVAVIMRDISYKYHEMEQMKLVFDQAPNAQIICNEQGLIELCNARVVELFGYSMVELIEQPIEVLVPMRAAQHSQLRDAYLQHPTARRMGAGRDLTARHKSGREVPVEIGLNPIVLSNRRFVLASIVDITERIRAQENLNAANRLLVEKNKEMEQFIYTVSHDLRSPLVTIEAFARKLIDELKNQINEKQRHRLERIQANVEHMEKLLLNLLDLSRVIQHPIEKKWVDTASVLKQVMSSLEVEIQKSGAILQVTSELTPIYANESMLHQCLQNLIGNSIKYRDLNRALVISIGCHSIPGFVELSVQDNGIGIHEKYHEQIFRIFERLQGGEGTGVGLAIVKTVMDKHNGKIVLHSKEGEGSEFVLSFPIEIQEATEA